MVNLEQDGADLTTVGTDALHTAMENAITQAKACMEILGPTPCVYGINPFTDGQTILSETTMLYESSYAMHISQLHTIVDSSKVSCAVNRSLKHIPLILLRVDQEFYCTELRRQSKFDHRESRQLFRLSYSFA